MDIVQISDIFNTLAQLHPDVNFYHCGTHDKVNQSGIDNNWDPGNSTGKQYPMLLFPYEAMTTSKNLTNQRQLSKANIVLLFYDTMYYNGTASATTGSKNDKRTDIEIARDLEAIAIGFLAAIRKSHLEEIKVDACNGIGIEGPVKFEYLPMQHNDRLMCIRCDFIMTYFSECQPFEPDFSQLVPPNAVPVPDYDLEDPNNS